MTWERALSIVLGIAAGNLALAYHQRFRMWRDARTEIPCYRNWRGEYVPDLHFTRIKRALWLAWALFWIIGLPFAYFQLTGY